jgi:curli biogenesis system outer membrane secretion channel CsgG
MKTLFKLLLSASLIVLFISGCTKTVQIKALTPAEVAQMSDKKNIAVSKFGNDSIGLSAKIESNLANHKLDGQKYFTVLSRRDMDKVIREQKLQSSELMDEKTSTRVGKLIGAQAIINGEVSSSNAESRVYYDNRKECLKYVKDKGCVQWHFYKVKCDTTKATVSASINIVNIETGSLIYGDTLSKNYDGDSCRAEGDFLNYLVLAPTKILSKGQAIDRLTSDIANEFVHKLTPNYIYLRVALLEDIELDSVTDEQEQEFENSLAYINAGRMKRADEILSKLMDELDGKSYVVAYTSGVVKEAEGLFDEAKQLYELADRVTSKPVEEINWAIVRIEQLIAKRDEAKRQIDAK